MRHSFSKRTDAGANPAGSANCKLPGGVKVARRFVKPHGVGASPTLAANFWKAGRYKLAALVSKTGSASPRSEHYRRLPPNGGRPQGSSRSSKTEHPADNRKTQERYLPGRPFPRV